MTLGKNNGNEHSRMAERLSEGLLLSRLRRWGATPHEQGMCI